MQRVLGVRCGHDGYAFCVLEGIKTIPKLIYKSDYIPIPSRIRSQQLLWIYEEFDKIMTKYDPNICVMNISGKTMNHWRSGDVVRKENEAVVQLILAKHNIKEIFERKNNQLEIFNDDLNNLLNGATIDGHVSEAIKAGFYKLKNGKQ